MTREEAIESFNHSNEQAKMRLVVEKMRMDISEVKELEFYIERDEMAIEALEQESRWIPVSERLPEDKQSVLVWCPQYKNIYCAYHEKEQWWIFGAFVQIVPNEIIAWMPLPQPYKAESEVQDEDSD